MEKLRNMRPEVRISEPRTHVHLQTKPKQAQLIEERNSEIERENRILLEKMTSILQNQKAPGSSQPAANSAPVVGASPAVARDQSGQQFYVSQSLQGSTLQNRKSLNRDARKRELMKITMENQKILQRL